MQHFPKKSRFTLGKKIDALFIEVIELIFIAGYLPREQKLPYLKKAVGRFDLLKFFIQISWETKILDNNRYLAISSPLDEIGKMLGGWSGQLAKQTPANKNAGGK